MLSIVSGGVMMMTGPLHSHGVSFIDICDILMINGPEHCCCYVIDDTYVIDQHYADDNNTLSTDLWG